MMPVAASLKIEQLLPNQRVLVARAVVGQYVFVHVAQKLVEDVVEHQKIDAFWRVLLVDRCDVVDDGGGDVFNLLGVGPDLVKELQIGRRERRFVHLVDQIGNCIAWLVAQVHRCKAMQGHVDGFGCISTTRFNAGEGLHRRLRAVGHEARLELQPIGALTGDGALRQLVAQMDFELTAVQVAFTVELGDVKFLALFADLVRHIFGHESGRGEDEVELLDLFQLGLQRLKRIHRKARGRHLQARAGLQGSLEVIAQQAVDVVDQFHRACLSVAQTV